MIQKNNGSNLKTIFKSYGSPQMERIKKLLQKIFKGNVLEEIIDCNMKTVNYLCYFRHYHC